MDYRSLAEELLHTLAFQRIRTDDPQHLNSGERGILNYLHFYGDGSFPGAISRDLGLSTGRTAIALKSLEKKGMISRNVSETDRRCVVVKITEAGRASAEAFRMKVLDSTESVLRRLGEEDAREYVRILRRISEINFSEDR